MNNDDMKFTPQSHQTINADMIKASTGPLLKFIGGFWMIFFLFSTAALGIGTFIIGQMNQSFFKSAIQSQAVITDIDTQSYTETTTDTNNRKVYTEKKRIILYVSFPADQTQIKAKIDDSYPTTYKKGDSIEIAYNPVDPKSVKKLSDKENIDFLFLLSKIFTGIFLTICFVFYVLTRRTARTKEINPS